MRSSDQRFPPSHRGPKAHEAGGAKHRHRIFHTATGSLALISSLASFARPECISFVVASIVLSSVVAIHSSLALQEQAPLRTIICKSPLLTVAPHREAFQRTSTILLYVNARIIQELVFSATSLWWPRAAVFTLVTLTWIRMYIPWKGLDLSNGNTFCFVIPMMTGVFGDYAVKVLATNSNDLSTSTDDDIRWLSLQELLLVQASGLIIAFLFTLSFRKLIPIQKLYFLSAATVNLMVLLGTHQAAKLCLRILQ